MEATVGVVDPQQDERWDAFVAQHPCGWICHLSGWQRVLESSFPHVKGHFLAVKQEGAIRAGLPVYAVRSPVMGNRLVSIPFATLADPLVSSAGEACALLQGARELARTSRARALEIRARDAHLPFPAGALGVDCFYKNHYLALDRPPELLRKSFHRSCVCQRIARAQQSGLVITRGETRADLAAFYDLYLVTRRRLGLPPLPRRFLEKLWETFQPAGALVLWLARMERTPVGGVILFRYRQRVSAEFAVCDHRYKSVSPLHGLFWESIQWAHREGCAHFDFGRTAPDQPHLMEFKSRWGTTVMDLPRYYDPPAFASAPPPGQGRTARRVVQALCRFMPRPVFVGLGNLLYRHLS